MLFAKEPVCINISLNWYHPHMLELTTIRIPKWQGKAEERPLDPVSSFLTFKSLSNLRNFYYLSASLEPHRFITVPVTLGIKGF